MLKLLVFLFYVLFACGKYGNYNLLVLNFIQKTHISIVLPFNCFYTYILFIKACKDIYIMDVHNYWNLGFPRKFSEPKRDPR